MKKSFLLLILLLSQFLMQAQDELIVRQSEKGLYILHIVAPKENFYSIGRLFNVHPKEIASFNSLDMNKGLSIGQQLMIPLISDNFSQKNGNGRPVYYLVGPGEGLYRVSVKNNNVLMADLRKWNRLSSDQISEGQKLVIGYLVSPEAARIVASDPSPEEEPIKEEPPVNTNPVRTEEEPVKTEPKPENQPPNNQQVSYSGTEGGYFRTHFEKQIRSQPAKKDETASTGIFKTASGWQDGKYYALIDGVEPGSIIKVINPTNSKIIFAKVLGGMSGIRQNEGYDVRISNAAASALDVSDTDKFIVRVNY